MGLITEILTFPLAPLRGTKWVLDQALEVAEREYYDPAPVRGELADLEQDLLDGRITEEEFEIREDELLDRLEQLQAEQERMRE